MTKAEQIVEHVIVTFFEAAIAYVAINQTALTGNVKLTAIGALGAGLSVTYNLARQAAPTLPVLPEPPVVAPVVVEPTVAPIEPVVHPTIVIPVTDAPVEPVAPVEPAASAPVSS